MTDADRNYLGKLAEESKKILAKLEDIHAIEIRNQTKLEKVITDIGELQGQAKKK